MAIAISFTSSQAAQNQGCCPLLVLADTSLKTSSCGLSSSKPFNIVRSPFLAALKTLCWNWRLYGIWCWSCVAILVMCSLQCHKSQTNYPILIRLSKMRSLYLQGWLIRSKVRYLNLVWPHRVRKNARAGTVQKCPGNFYLTVNLVASFSLKKNFNSIDSKLFIRKTCPYLLQVWLIQRIQF